MTHQQLEFKQLKNYNYGKTNQTFPISADRLGTNLHHNIIGGTFSTNYLTSSYVSVI